ncbi:MAG: SRPBCC family protein [Bacteroidota bacterium]
MKNNFEAKVSVTIDAGASSVWKAITSPEMVKKYLMGTNVVTDWKEGSPISYEGEYNGKKYKDKGVIEKVEPGKIFQSTYWSSMGGKEDKPENYNLVTYKLDAKGDQTIVTLTQDNVQSEKEKEHAAENWKSVLQKLKTVVEENEHHPA